jgi:hypothetical protein
MWRWHILRSRRCVSRVLLGRAHLKSSYDKATAEIGLLVTIERISASFSDLVTRITQRMSNCRICSVINIQDKFKMYSLLCRTLKLYSVGLFLYRMWQAADNLICGCPDLKKSLSPQNGTIVHLGYAPQFWSTKINASKNSIFSRHLVSPLLSTLREILGYLVRYWIYWVHNFLYIFGTQNSDCGTP